MSVPKYGGMEFQIDCMFFILLRPTYQSCTPTKNTFVKYAGIYVGILVSLAKFSAPYIHENAGNEYI